jgi:Na+-driven multidrug efflux pump
MLNTWIMSLHSLEDVAVFNVVIVLYSVFQMGFSSITTVLIPQVSLYAAQGKGVRLPGEKLLIGIIAGAILLAIAMPFFPKQEILLYKLFHSEIYVRSFKYLAILVIGFPFRIFTMSNKGITQGLGDTKSIAVIAFVVTLFNIGVFYPLYIRFHIVGALTAMVICYILEYFLTRYKATKMIKQLRCQHSLGGAAV